MGYRTPNIDRIAKDGALFTHWCGQQSCTAGRAAFITGQSPTDSGTFGCEVMNSRGLVTGADLKMREDVTSSARYVLD